MKTLLLSVCAIIAAVSFIAAGCKKKDNNPSVQSMLAGNWKTTGTGYDVNKNGVIDADETKLLPDTVSFNTFFDQGGTGVSTETVNGRTDTLSFFTWALGDNNTEITTTRTKGYASFVSLSSSNTYKLATLTTTDLQLTIVPAGGGLNWDNYKKQ